MKTTSRAILFQNIRKNSKEQGELSGTLAWLASIAREYFKADICVIFPMNPVTRTFLREDPIIAGKLKSANLEDFNKPRENGLAKLVLSKKILLIEGKDIEKYHSPITQIENIRAFAGFGLFTSRLKTPLAVVYLDYKKNKKFGEKNRADINSFIEFASAELQNTWFIRRYREITRVGQDINESFENIEQMFDRVYEHLKGILDVNYSFSLLNYDSQTQKADLYLKEEGNKHIKRDYKLMENSASAWVIKNLKTIAFDDFYKEKRPGGLQAVHIPGTASKEKSVIFVPIKITNKPFGVLSIQHQKRKYYGKDDLQILELLANHIALALNNNRLLEDLKGRRLQELEDLRQIDKEISGTLDLDAILKIILELTSKHIKADNGVILLHNKKFNAIEVRAFKGLSSRPANQRLDQYKGIVKSAFEMKKTIRINDVRGDSEWKDKYIEFSKETNSELAVPLILGGDAIGVMNFESNEKDAYSEDSQWFIETLAGQAVIAIKNATEYERTKRIAREREALIDIVNELITQSDFKEIFSIILAKALELTETSYGTISECDEEKRKIRNITANGVSDTWRDEIHSFDEGIKGKVARDKRYIKIDNLMNSPLRVEYLDVFHDKMESLLAVPILEGDRIRGVINLESENPYHFEEDDVELIHSLASLCAVAIRTVGSIQQKQLASVGVITGDIYHKMNSPLAKIQKLIEIIQSDYEITLKSNNDLTQKINTIHNIISETIKLVKQKIDIANRSFIKTEKISLEHSIKKAIADTELPGNIIIKNQIEGQKEFLYVFATPQLASVFQNFMANAIRAMPDGGKIFFDIESIDESWVIISVENTGVGIPEHLRPLVFETSDRGEGHGFGLRWTKAYIETHGGKIDIPTSGRDNKGTKFVLHLKKA